MTTATLDRQTADYAILCAADGRTWDVYGDNWAELREEARLIAAHEGLTIDLYNSETPEA